MLNVNPELLSELKKKLLNIQAHEELGQMKLREELIYQTVSLARYAGLPSGYRTVEDSDVPQPEWAGDIVAFVELPTGQVAYYLPLQGVAYDNHTRSEKLERIKDFIEDNYTLEGEVSQN